MMAKPCPTPRSHLISDINDANRLLCRVAFHSPDNRKLQRILYEQLMHLQERAAVAFASLNGWKVSTSPFRLSKLGSVGPDYYWRGSTTIFDHCIFFRQHRRAAAVLAQPYAKNFKSICEAQRLADQLGIQCAVPPCPWSSFHFPQWTQTILFCHRDHGVVWLPEHVNGIAWSSAS
jgi:hypothetical protein